MRTLLLLRHAKSSWDNSSLSDFDRPLAKRGEKAAPKMGAFIAAQGLEPDVVLCSSAKRAKDTLKLVFKAFSTKPEIHYEDGLYMAGPRKMIKRAQSVLSSAKSIMIVGHNPGMHALALELLSEGSDKDVLSLATKYPTAALAVFDLMLENWADLDFHSARLRLYQVPRKL